jgi:hypothetical protein
MATADCSFVPAKCANVYHEISINLHSLPFHVSDDLRHRIFGGIRAVFTALRTPSSSALGEMKRWPAWDASTKSKKPDSTIC